MQFIARLKLAICVGVALRVQCESAFMHVREHHACVFVVSIAPGSVHAGPTNPWLLGACSTCETGEGLGG